MRAIVVVCVNKGRLGLSNHGRFLHRQRRERFKELGRPDDAAGLEQFVWVVHRRLSVH